MKIAIDIRAACEKDKAGKAWYTYAMTENLLKLDKKNQFLLFTNKHCPNFEKYNQARQILIPSRGLLWHLKAAIRLRKEKPDFYFSPTSYITPVLLSKSTKTLLTVHDLVAIFFQSEHNKKASIIEKLLLKTAFKKAYKVLAVSENTKKDLEKHLKVNGSKIITVPCGVNPEFRKLDSEKLKIFKKRTNLPDHFFLSVGTLIPRKNYVRLIKAFAKLNKKYPKQHLVIVGRKGWNYEEIFAEIKKRNLNKNIHYLAVNNQNLVALYNLAEAFVFPSLYEGFGIPPLESMQCECPVLASNKSSIPEVVGEAALTFDPENTKEIYLSMLKLKQQPEIAENLIKKAKEQIGKFSWQKSAQKILDIYES